MHKGEKVLGIYMDLTNAFDSVCHKTLLKKLQDFGIKGINLKWFQSYLSGREQFVEITSNKNNYQTKVTSAKHFIKWGVPQGSILGPILFLCYIKDLPKTIANPINNKLCLYADDSNLKVSGKNVNDLEISAFVELTNIQQFLNTNNLYLNASKMNFMPFSTKQNKNKTEPNLIVNSTSIEQVSNTKFLGLHIDKHLDWNFHIEKLLKILNSGLFALKKMSYLCNLDALKKVYFAHIHSHICYGISLYGATSKQNLNKILTVQKKAIRIMLHLKTDESVKLHFKELNILTFYGAYIFETTFLAKEESIKKRTF